MTRNLWIVVVAIAVVIWLMKTASAREIAGIKAGLDPETAFDRNIDLPPV